MPQQRFQVANMSYLQISGLKISYGDKVVLHNIDLAVEQGEMIALLGPSGCGKTTLLNALCGFIPVQSGEVAIASRTITHLAPEQQYHHGISKLRPVAAPDGSAISAMA